MARFVLKYLLNGRPNRNRADQAVDRERLVLGSRPSADIFVKERLVGSEAAVLSFDGTRLSVEILDDFAGAFLEGRPVAGKVPFPDGASLQVGYLLVKAAIDAAKGTCTLTVSEGYLPSVVEWFVKQEKPEKAFALESSGPQEHLWGASPVLRRLNGIALALGAAALLAFPILKDTSAVTRGELARHHQAAAVEGAPKGCADCHDPFRSDYAPKCLVCHKGFDDEKLHPYDAAKEIACASCHEEHRGAGASLIPVVAPATPEAWPPLCARCHAPRVAGLLGDPHGPHAHRGRLLPRGPPHPGQEEHRIRDARPARGREDPRRLRRLPPAEAGGPGEAGRARPLPGGSLGNGALRALHRLPRHLGGPGPRARAGGRRLRPLPPPVEGPGEDREGPPESGPRRRRLAVRPAGAAPRLPVRGVRPLPPARRPPAPGRGSSPPASAWSATAPSPARRTSPASPSRTWTAARGATPTGRPSPRPSRRARSAR